MFFNIKNKENYSSKKDLALMRNFALSRKRGFTLIEVLVVIGILAILATLVLVAVNPSKQFKMTRDTKRAADVATILSSISQNIADHSGSFMCQGNTFSIPSDVTPINSEAGGFNLATCVVAEYISALPFDPGNEYAFWTNETDFETGYTIKADTNGRVTISAPSEVSPGQEISATR